MKIIDVWMQQPTERFLTQPFLDSLLRWTRRTEIRCPPLKATIGAMDEAGVGMGILSAWWGPAGPLIGNDEVAGFVAAHPDRFAGLASVDLSRPMDAVRELRRCVRELGFRGLRVVPWLWNLPPDDRRYYPLYAECVELDVPFCLQVGHTGPLMSSEPGRPIPYLEHVALEFPELRIVGGHIGHPWTQEMISLMTKCENVYVDLCLSLSPPGLVERLVAAAGIGKIVWGSDAYFLSMTHQIGKVLGARLTDDEKVQVLSTNARRLLDRIER